jgi:predicted chitinase
MKSVTVSSDGQGAVAVSSAGQFYTYGTAPGRTNPKDFTNGIVGLSLTSDGQGMAAMSGAGEIYAYGTVQWLGNGDPGPANIVTSAMLQQVFGASSTTINDGLPSLNAEMAKGSINNAPRIAALLATLKAESAFRYNAKEACSSTASYYPYCGRGFIQLTWKSNYSAAGTYVGRDLVSNMEDARSLAYSAAIMRWYWTVSHTTLNTWADQLNMGKITRAVNGSGASTTTLTQRCNDFKKVLTYYGYAYTPAQVICS